MIEAMRRGTLIAATRSVGFIQCEDGEFVAVHGQEVEAFPFSFVAASCNPAQFHVGELVIIGPRSCTIGGVRIMAQRVAVFDTVIRGPIPVAPGVVELIERQADAVTSGSGVLRELESAWSIPRSDSMALRVRKRIGWGRGLTPSFDDALLGFVAGWHVAAVNSCHLGALVGMLGTLPPGLTTDVSRALLREAARGRFPPALAELCSLLTTHEQANARVHRVSGIGATSGREMLAGLALALRIRAGPSGGSR